MYVKISKDSKTFFLNTGNESVLLNNGKQDILRWFESKHILKIVSKKNEFYCLACNDYDKEIDILNTSDSNFKFHIKRKIAPNIIRFLDIKIDSD